ncbi:unnamed protein product [Parajaminaea phylloscopi]
MVDAVGGLAPPHGHAESSAAPHRRAQKKKKNNENKGHRTVPISVLPSGRALVWDPSDVLYLRSHHRIIGILTGSLPLLPQQNAYLGIPLQLMPEEVALLVERNAAVLVDDAAAHLPSSGQLTEAEWEQWQSQQAEGIRTQRLQAYKETQRHKRRFERALAAQATTGANKGKRAQEAKKALAAAAAREGGPGTGTGVGGSEEEEDEGGDDDDVSEPEEATLATYSYHHTTMGASTGLPWYCPPASSDGKSDGDGDQHTRRLVGILDEAAGMDPLHRLARRRVFAHLNQDKHFYLSCGLRFGGDFVVYPGDPFRYHSHFTLTVPRDTEAPIPAAKLIADGRLGTAVKKVHVIGTTTAAAKNNNVGDGDDGDRSGGGDGDDDDADDDDGQDRHHRPVFYSLTWAGFGT